MVDYTNVLWEKTCNNDRQYIYKGVFFQEKKYRKNMYALLISFVHI